MCGMRRTIDYLNTIITLDPVNAEIFAADLCGIFTPETIEALNPAVLRAMHQTHHLMGYQRQIELGILAVARTQLNEHKQVH